MKSPIPLLAAVLFAGVFINGLPAPAQAGDTPSPASPFDAYISQAARQGAVLSSHGEPVPIVRETSRVEGDNLVADRSVLKFDGAIRGWQTTVLSTNPGAAYLLDRVQVPGDTNAWEISYPLPADFHPATWEFSNDSGNAKCDILVYDGKAIPEVLEAAYGINKIPQDSVKIPEGTPVMRVRVLFAAPYANTIKDFHPVIRSDGSEKKLFIPLPAKDADVRVAFYPERYRETRLTAINNLDFSKTTLRFAGLDDHYQFGADGALAVKREVGESAPSVLPLGMDYFEEPEPQGRLIAFCDFETLESGKTPVLEANLQAAVSDGRLVDAGVLDGKALYLGQRRVKSTASLTIPGDLRQSFTQDQMTISFWIKLPWGQLGKNPLVFWPYRRGAEGLKEPFAIAWSLGQFGPIFARFNRWDASDDLVLGGFSHSLNAPTSVKLGPPGWNHVAISVRASDARLFLNGKMKGEIAFPARFSLEALQKGGPIVLFSDLWGTIDKVRIHDFALSEKQVAAMVKDDLPKTLLHYPLETVSQGLTPATPGGDFPVDEWSWDMRDFSPEVTFAARATSSTPSEGDLGKSLRLGPDGLVIPPKALMDLGIDRFATAFWFRSAKPDGVLLTSNNHPKHGFTFKFHPKRIFGVLCGNYQVIESSVNCPPGEWHHFAFSYDNQELRVFFDGKLVKKAPFIPKESLNLQAGLIVAPGMEGEVADLRILGSMIDEKDVRKLMQFRRPNGPEAP